MRNITYILTVIIFIPLLNFGQKIEFKLKASGNVIDLVVLGDLLYAATDNGTVDVFNFKSKKLLSQIRVPMIKDFMGDNIPAKVYSVDVTIKGDVVLVYQGDGGFRNISVYHNRKLQNIISAETDKMMIKKAKLVNDKHLLFGQLSNEIMLFDLGYNKEIFEIQVSTSSFSDFVLSEDKTRFIATDESGKIRMFDSSNGKLIEEYSGNNVDNIYKLDYKSDMIIGGGQDRRIAIYNTFMDDKYYLQNDFLVYCVGLSPDGKLGAYSANEDNDVVVFNTSSKVEVNRIEGQNSTLTGIYFLSRERLIITCEDPEIVFWILNE